MKRAIEFIRDIILLAIVYSMFEIMKTFIEWGTDPKYDEEDFEIY